MEQTSQFGAGIIRDWTARQYTCMARALGYTNVKAVRQIVREADPKKRAEIHHIYVTDGVYDINEVRSELGKPPIDNGDQPLIPSTQTPLDTVLNPPALPEAPKPTGEPEPEEDKETKQPKDDERINLAELRRYLGMDKLETELQAVYHQTDQKRLGIDDGVLWSKEAGWPTVYLIRHAHTNFNSDSPDEERVRGWADVPLSGEGKAQARVMAERAAKLGIKQLRCSDMKRTQQTAKAISEITGIPVSQCSRRWRPWNMGRLQGALYNDVQDVLHRHVKDAPHEPLPDGESFHRFKDRFLKAMRAAMSQAGQTGPIGIVTHSRNIKLAQAWLANGAQDDLVDHDIYLARDSDPGDVAVVTYTGQGWGVGIMPQEPTP